MPARHIQEFRQHLLDHPKYRKARRDFHEAYELLEGYWRNSRTLRNFDGFCDTYGDFYWNLPKVRDLAHQLACEGPVGNSDHSFQPSPHIVQATRFLLGQDIDGHQRPFKAMMVIVYQIRNNLFHGRKLELEEAQLQRNTGLIATARDIVFTLLDHLEEAEEAAGREE